MEQHTLKSVNNCFNSNTYSYLETCGGETSNLYLNVLIFPTFIHNVTLIRHLWQLKTLVFLHWCLIRVVLLNRLQPCPKVEAGNTKGGSIVVQLTSCLTCSD
jgi:hypothetical protein